MRREITCRDCGERFVGDDEVLEELATHAVEQHPEVVAWWCRPPRDVSPRDPRIAAFTQGIGRGSA
jgi:hypothetical protein